MPNIPPLRQKPEINRRLINRASKALPSENSAQDSTQVSRKLERRHRKDRRQKQIAVRFERRMGLNRRHSKDLAAEQATDSAELVHTVGKHINTTA